jgi:hypothetical protein
MTNPIVLKISLANTSNVAAEDVYDYIENNAKNAETYQFKPKKGIYASGFDYILTTVGSLASIGALIWMAYEKFIGSKKETKNKEDKSGIIIFINFYGTKPLDFWLGNTYRDKENFIKAFTKQVGDFRKTKQAKKDYDRTMWELKSSGLWVRRK